MNQKNTKTERFLDTIYILSEKPISEVESQTLVDMVNKFKHLDKKHPQYFLARNHLKTIADSKHKNLNESMKQSLDKYSVLLEEYYRTESLINSSGVLKKKALLKKRQQNIESINKIVQNFENSLVPESEKIIKIDFLNPLTTNYLINMCTAKLEYLNDKNLEKNIEKADNAAKNFLKKAGIAAALLGFFSFSYLFWNSDNNKTELSEKTVVFQHQAATDSYASQSVALEHFKDEFYNILEYSEKKNYKKADSLANELQKTIKAYLK